jgi:multiple sugar transport system ATP-binding protein
MRVELKRLQHELGITTLYVTHDQTEAMTLGDRITLLRQGHLVQVGTPAELYDYPETPFAATFVGSPPMNLLPATWHEQARQTLVVYQRCAFPVSAATAERLKRFNTRDIWLGMRPEHLHFTEEQSAQVITGTVHAVEPLGRERLFHIHSHSHIVLVLSATRQYAPGATVRIMPEVQRLHVFPQA